jgi:hypothetical protein
MVLPQGKKEFPMKKYAAQVRWLSLAIVAIAALFSTTDAFAQGGASRLRLSARMFGGGMQATAKYEERGATRMKFTFELEKGVPGNTVTVIANGSVSNVVLGTPVIDAFGRAKIDVDTEEGDSVTRLANGDTIIVQVNGQTVMQGVLRGR